MLTHHRRGVHLLLLAVTLWAAVAVPLLRPRVAHAQVAEAFAASSIVIPAVGTLTGAAAAPWIAAALGTIVVVGGGAYCTLADDCVASAQAFWTASSTWMTTYMSSQIASGANTIKWSTAAGYSQANLLTAYAAAYAAGGELLHYPAASYAGQLTEMDAIVLPSVSRTASTNVATVTITVPGPTYVDTVGATQDLLGIGFTLPDGTVTTGTAAGLRWVKNTVAAPTTWSNLSTASFEDAAADVVNAVQTNAVTAIDSGAGATQVAPLTLDQIALRVQTTASQQATISGFWYRWCESRSFSCTNASAWVYVPPSAFTFSQPSKATAPTPGTDPDKRILLVGAASLGALVGTYVLTRTSTGTTDDGQTSTLADPGVVTPTDAGLQTGQLTWLQSIYGVMSDTYTAIVALPTTIADAIEATLTSVFVPTNTLAYYTTAPLADLNAAAPVCFVTDGLDASDSLLSGAGSAGVTIHLTTIAGESIDLELGDSTAAQLARLMTRVALVVLMVLYAIGVYRRFFIKD